MTHRWPLCFTRAGISCLNAVALGNEDAAIIDWWIDIGIYDFVEFGTELGRHKEDAFSKPKPSELPVDII